MSSRETEKAGEDNVFSDKYPYAFIYDAVVFLGLLPVGGAPQARRSFVRLINPRPREKITELCCGTGSVSLLIHELTGEKVWSSDLSTAQVRVARAKAVLLRANVLFEAREASDTGFPGSFFDKAVVSLALHEIKRKRRLAIYREAGRILKPGGIFFVCEPDISENKWGRTCFNFFFGEWNPETPTTRELVLGGLENEITREGFSLHSKSSSNFGIFKNLVFRKK